MQTLVIDTSYGSTVGVVGHEPIVETDSRTHVEKLQVNIAQAVEQAGLQASDITRIVVGQGHLDGVRAFVSVWLVIFKRRRFPLAAQRERRFLEFPKRASPYCSKYAPTTAGVR